MAVFKRRHTGGNGKKEPVGKWNVQFTDATGIVRRLPGFSDKGATQELERGILRLVSARASGMAPDAEMVRFIEGLPEAMRDKLTKWDILDARRSAAGKPLADLVAAWKRHMESRELSHQYRGEAVARVRRIFADCHFLRITDVDAGKVENWLADRRREDNMSARTSNSHLASAKTFFGYLVKAGLASSNPLTRIARANEAADPRLERRPLTADEMSSLLTATERAGKRFGLTGPERALLYTLAAESGLRWSELRGLVKRDFNFEERTLSVRASISKNAKDATLPLLPDTAERLAVHMQGFAPDSPAFPGAWRRRGAEMLHADMELVGIPVYDEYGRKADFHCLRGTTATMLSEANVPLPTVQQIMRHSTPALTAKHYVRLSVIDKARAQEKLPDFRSDKPDAESMKATGTDGKATAENTPQKNDTKNDTNRSEKRLFQAMNSYNTREENENENNPCKTNKPLENKGLDDWSGRWESNPRDQLGRLGLYH